MIKLIEYFLNIDLDLSKAIEYIEEIEQKILNSQSLMNLYPNVLTHKSQAYLLLKDLKAATNYTERAWFDYGVRNDKLFKILTDIYKATNDWEILEDFCQRAYYENEYSPIVFEDLYLAYLKRKAFKKSTFLFERVKKHYPDYLHRLEHIKEKRGEEEIS